MKETRNEREERDAIREEAKRRKRRTNKETIEEGASERERDAKDRWKERGEERNGRSVVVDEEAKIYVRTYVRGSRWRREVRDGSVTGLSIRAASEPPPSPSLP